jgi:hypothetical protein
MVHLKVSLALIEIYSPALLATCDEVDALQVGGTLQALLSSPFIKYQD